MIASEDPHDISGDGFDYEDEILGSCSNERHEVIVSLDSSDMGPYVQDVVIGLIDLACSGDEDRLITASNVPNFEKIEEIIDNCHSDIDSIVTNPVIEDLLGRYYLPSEVKTLGRDTILVFDNRFLLANGDLAELTMEERMK